MLLNQAESIANQVMSKSPPTSAVFGLESDGTIGDSILNEVCDPSGSCSTDAAEFKGVLMRNMGHFASSLANSSAPTVTPTDEGYPMSNSGPLQLRHRRVLEPERDGDLGQQLAPGGRSGVLPEVWSAPLLSTSTSYEGTPGSLPVQEIQTSGLDGLIAAMWLPIQPTCVGGSYCDATCCATGSACTAAGLCCAFGVDTNGTCCCRCGAKASSTAPAACSSGRRLRLGVRLPERNGLQRGPDEPRRNLHHASDVPPGPAGVWNDVLPRDRGVRLRDRDVHAAAGMTRAMAASERVGTSRAGGPPSHPSGRRTITIRPFPRAPGNIRIMLAGWIDTNDECAPMTPHFRHLAACMVAAALVLPSKAHADEPPARPAAGADDGGKPVDRVWYGWQPVIGDAASTTALFLSTSTNTGSLGVIGLGGYLFASPAIHLAHGHAGKAALSFALRAALPLVGYGIGAAAASSDTGATRGLLGISHSSSLPGTATLGFVFGALVAVVVDDTSIAREDVARARPVAEAVTWQPTVAPSAHGALVGLEGRFTAARDDMERGSRSERSIRGRPGS